MSKTPLTAKAIEAAQPQDKPYKLTDSMTPGLFLLVHPNGSKYWRFRYWIDKKERLQAIGVYPLISLKEARKRATESRLLIAQGIDPMDLARKEKAIDALNAIASFKAVAEDWMATKVSGWSESYTKQVRSALMPQADRRNHARNIAGNKYKTPDFNPTQEDRDRAEMMCEERWKRVIDKLIPIR